MSFPKQAEFGWILDELIKTPHTRHALYLSADGLAAAGSQDLERDLADKIAAAVSGLQSLSHGTAAFADCEGPSDLTLIHYPAGGYVFLMAAGNGAHLAVSADGEADMEDVSFAMETTVTRLGSHLDIAPRTAAVNDA